MKKVFRSVGTVLLGLLTGFPPLVNADVIPVDFDKRTVAFIFLHDTNGNHVANGTCFFVSVESTNTDVGAYLYLVTADHVLRDEAGQMHSQVMVRFSKQGGGTEFVYFPLATNGPLRVFKHPEAGVDLAVIPVAVSTYERYRFPVLSSRMLASKDHITKFKIRESDEMFFFGLFTPFYGSTANIPVFRFGRLSMLPDEKIPVGDGPPQFYYLMEAQAFGGNSGSPALFMFDNFRNPGDAKFLLAGVVKGYYRNFQPVHYVNSKSTPFSSETRAWRSLRPRINCWRFCLALS